MHWGIGGLLTADWGLLAERNGGKECLRRISGCHWALRSPLSAVIGVYRRRPGSKELARPVAEGTDSWMGHYKLHVMIL